MTFESRMRDLVPPRVGDWDQERLDMLTSCFTVAEMTGDHEQHEIALREISLEVLCGFFFVEAFTYLMALVRFQTMDDHCSYASRRLPDGRRIVVLRRLFGQALLVIGRMSFSDPTYDHGWLYTDPIVAVEAMRRWDLESELEPSGWRERDAGASCMVSEITELALASVAQAPGF